MSAHYIYTGTSVAIVHCADVYRYHGVTFEWHQYCGPVLCKKDGNPSERNIGRKTGKVIDQWLKLTPSKKERTRIYG